MALILNRGKFLVPKKMSEIKYMGHTERKAIQLTKKIARQFGEQSKKMKPKKIIFR